ncbi:MAG: hypothetical protein PHX18_04825 [Candidatus Gastranaerophilales bacterium]|nr:hypothetical protein [Candidatus Gastranaerophilales bacterium]
MRIKQIINELDNIDRVILSISDLLESADKAKDITKIQQEINQLTDKLIRLKETVNEKRRI